MCFKSTRQNYLLLKALTLANGEYVDKGSLYRLIEQVNRDLEPSHRFRESPYLLGELLQASIRAGEIKKAPTGDIKITPLGIGNMRVLKDFVDRKDDVEGPEPALAS